MAEPDFIVFDDFSGGMNTQIARQGLPEKFAAWMENLQPIAGNFLLAVPAPAGAGVTLVGEKIVRLRYATIGTTDYEFAFCASGAGYATAITGNSAGQPVTFGAPIKFAPAGTFSPTGGDLAGFNAARVLIADSLAGYATWDGTIFVQQGGVSPNFAIQTGGSGAVNGVTIAITGGSGSGATATGTVVGGVLTAVNLTNPGTGYLAADTITVTVTNVGGVGVAATVNGHVWPFVSPLPTTLGVGFGRVWLGSARTLIATGTGSATYGAGYDDFASARAAVTTVISDIDLVKQITAIRFLNNYLYIVGDNSVKAIGSISVTGAVTNFTITTLSSDQGTIYLDTVLSYNRLLVFANTVGVFAVFGASVEKISDQMDGIFRAVNFVKPLSSAVNDINNIHTYLLLVSYIDPQLGPRGLILAFANKRWYVISQGSMLSVFGSAVLGGITVTFGSSGADITQLLQSLTAPLNFKLSTSLTPHGDPIREKRIVRSGIAVTIGTSATIDLMLDADNVPSVEALIGGAPASPQAWLITNNQGQALVFQNAQGQVLNFVSDGIKTGVFGTGFALAHSGEASQTGRYVGATATGNATGLAFQAIMLEVQPGSPWGKG